MQQVLNHPGTRRLALGALGFGGIGYIIQNMLYNVEPGHRGIIFDRLSGIKDFTACEGTHFFIPFLQRPIIFDVRTRPRTIHSVTGTKDLQLVNISLRILSRPNSEKLVDIYRHLGESFEEKVLPSIANEVLKGLVAQSNAEDLLMKRDKISQEITKNLILRATEFNIIVDDVSITHLAFSKEFSKAIEAKQVAEQIAEKAKFIVDRTEQEKQASIIAAEGESEAAALISNALKESGHGLIQLRRIEAAREIAGTLAGGRNITYLPGKGNMLLQLPAK
uniref:Prohibitin n=1 Tax=Hirondellea gigas TaxID=1518452 RepID=A0A6A7FYC6_9CRUS